ncbi:MAG: DUF3570 domain-containing protein [bacterium]
MARSAGLTALLLVMMASAARAQDLPADELQVNLNSYFDSFDVTIVYPSISYTKRMTDSSTINVRYLVDVISAASMRSHFIVDGVTSATEKEDGGGDNTPDEVRHELGAGITQLINGGTLSVNGLFSKEHDYRSVTLAGSFSYPFAQKNTTLQLGLVRSWDKIFPQIRDWRKEKDVYTASINLTQVLSKRLIGQLIASYNHSKGLLSDPYQVVQLIQNSEPLMLEPVHPNERTRKAFGVRMNYKIERTSALQFGIRYYWDDWAVRSFTTSISFLQHVSEATTVGLGFRNYFQSRAFFYKEKYEQPEEFMTVDSKLDEGFSNQYQFKLVLNGGHFQGIPLLRDENIQLSLKLNFYHRHTVTPNWHRRAKDLYAYIMSLGVRYRF